MMDLVLQAWVGGSIELAKLKWILGGGKPWQPGERLKLLFAGYNGTRNTGADVRVEEMLRQLRHLLGADRVEFSVMSQNFARTQGYFAGTRQVKLSDVFPPFLGREIPRHDGVVACEGSMFKSKFANALTTMMIGSLGIAAAMNKLSVGYGAEAGNIGINIGVAAPMAFFPFTGWKDSLFGDMHGQGMDAVEFFTQKKVVVERWPKEWSRQF